MDKQKLRFLSLAVKNSLKINRYLSAFCSCTSSNATFKTARTEERDIGKKHPSRMKAHVETIASAVTGSIDVASIYSASTVQ